MARFCLVGIKRRFWFGYKVFRCKDFFIKGYAELYAQDGTKFEGPISPCLVLKFENGREMHITNIENRDWWSEVYENGVPSLT